MAWHWASARGSTRPFFHRAPCRRAPYSLPDVQAHTHTRTHLELRRKRVPVAVATALCHRLARERAVLVAEHHHVRVWLDGVGEEVALETWCFEGGLQLVRGAARRREQTQRSVACACRVSPGLDSVLSTMLKMVSLVPRLTPTSPGLLRPRPARLQGGVGASAARVMSWGGARAMTRRRALGCQNHFCAPQRTSTSFFYLPVGVVSAPGHNAAGRVKAKALLKVGADGAGDCGGDKKGKGMSTMVRNSTRRH